MTRKAAPRRHLPTSPFPPTPVPEIEQYAVDDRVTHDAYGLGWVVAVDQESVTVDFGSHRRTIASPFAKLTKL